MGVHVFRPSQLPLLTMALSAASLLCSTSAGVLFSWALVFIMWRPFWAERVREGAAWRWRVSRGPGGLHGEMGAEFHNCQDCRNYQSVSCITAAACQGIVARCVPCMQHCVCRVASKEGSYHLHTSRTARTPPAARHDQPWSSQGTGNRGKASAGLGAGSEVAQRITHPPRMPRIEDHPSVSKQPPVYHASGQSQSRR